MHDEIINKFLDGISSVREEVKVMYLFGSRSRDDWKPDSDYDILIVLEKKDRAVISSLYDAVIDILISTGKLVSLKIFSEAEYDRLRSIQTPFISNVLKEGISIGSNN
ncbi:MAG: nucleotidyltransferase domain-containing protein [Ignavibacteriaceae bacterium]|nr:nucleotidyltransferase domain-containing protein [Ignavibacteriaceae bacterium]